MSKKPEIGQDIKFTNWTGETKYGVITEIFPNGNFEVTSGFSKVLVYPSEVIEIESFGSGGLLSMLMSSDRYNTGKSWHMDRRMHNKRESYEKPLSERKMAEGGVIALSSMNMDQLLDLFEKHTDRIQIEIGSGKFSNSQPTMEWLESKIKELIESNFFDYEFYDNLPESEQKAYEVRYANFEKEKLANFEEFANDWLVKKTETVAKWSPSPWQSIIIMLDPSKSKRAIEYLNTSTPAKVADRPKLVLRRTGKVDHFSRPIYKSESGRIYVDTNMDDNDPEICTVSRDGEPDSPIQNYVIVD